MTTATGRTPRRARRFASPARCRGSVYLLVLGTSMLVTLLGLSALLLVRVERQMDAAAQDAAQARLFAQSAVELALQRIAADPLWRHTYSNDTWTADATLGRGTISFRFTDPDGDLDDDRTDAVVLTGRGQVGDAMRMCQVRLEPPGAADANLLVNPAAEAGITDWTTWGSGVEFNTTTSRSASGAAFRVEDGNWHGAVQDVTAHIQQGVSYTAAAWVYLDDQNENVWIGLILESTDDGTRYDALNGANYVQEDKGTRIEAIITPTWNGELTRAWFYVGTQSDQEFFLDDARLTPRHSAPMSPLPMTWRQVVE